MHSSIFRLFCTSAILLSGHHAHAVTLLGNPDFEAIVLNVGTSEALTDASAESNQTSAQVTPWAFSGAAGYLVTSGASSQTWGASSRFNSQFVVLGNLSADNQSSSLIQKFTISTAGLYHFSFDWQSASESEHADGSLVGGYGLLSMRLTTSGNTVGFAEVATESAQQGSLSALNVALPAGTAYIILNNGYRSNGGSFNYTYIDNVQATLVPEPASSALALLGLAGVALRRSRR